MSKDAEDSLGAAERDELWEGTQKIYPTVIGGNSIHIFI